MSSSSLFPVAGLLFFCWQAVFGEEVGVGFEDASIAELELKEEEINRRLRGLSQYSPRTGVGAIGYRSLIYDDPGHFEWIQIDLEEDVEVDEVVLVPVLKRNPDIGFLADGFPEKFVIRAGKRGDSVGEVVARFSGEEGLLPRVAPLIVPVNKRVVGWVKIEVNEMPVWARTKDYALQLSEVLIFSGERNVALRQPVSVSGGGATLNAWRNEFLTDSSVPYLVNVPRDVGTVSSTSNLKADSDSRFQISIDLGGIFPVSGLHLHAVDQNDTAPQSFFGDFGIPNHFLVEGSDSLDFSRSRELLEVRFDSVYEKSPLMMWNITPVSCRYIRIKVLDAYKAVEIGAVGEQVGFAEIAILANGENVALGKEVRGNFELSHPDQVFSRYTDGLNLYGVILPFRQWMEELAERHRLELELPIVSGELNRRYLKQKGHLQFTGWLVGLLGAGICVLFFYGKMLRVRQAAKIRERVAANLHDELGANLHAIGLLGDMAKRLVSSPEDLNEILERIRGLTDRTGAAARHCAHMMLAKGICDDVVAEMRRDATRILADLEHDFNIEGEDALGLLKRRMRIDLMLFYKECIINIIRHSGATCVKTRIVASGGELHLTVADNGKGFSGDMPQALKRRASLMGAKMNVSESEMGGVVVSLKRRFRIFKFS